MNHEMTVYKGKVYEKDLIVCAFNMI